MKSTSFRFEISNVNRLSDDVIYLTGKLIHGDIQPGQLALIAGTDLEIVIGSVVLVHSLNRLANGSH